ncbi:synaptotagmin-2-like [Saccoglossus kowalevskii]|uniref:Synaptotagmin-3-like n=1 Tax=Saccoglossus kowalevskii TaxID=10224 RepID=A0ABM0M1Z7_SACKO|nr:PREDICTED: synaptotagmin-3-like [Saccoglossus kowalevskii]
MKMVNDTDSLEARPAVTGDIPTPIILGTVSAIIFIVLLLIFIYYILKLKKKQKSYTFAMTPKPRITSAIIKMDNPPMPFLVPSLSNPEFAITKEYHNKRYKRRFSIEPIRMQLPLDELKLQDYQQRKGKENVSPSKYGLGKICFSVFFVKQCEQLTVTLLEAVHLPAQNMRGSADPYVKIVLLPDKRRKQFTKVHRKTLNPRFDETFKFNLPPEGLKSRTLQMVVYDFDRFSRPAVVGHVAFPLKQVDFKAPDNGKQFIWKNITNIIPNELKRGELLVSLTYLPNAKRLNVVVLKAKEVHNSNSAKITANEYLIVEVNMVMSGRVVKSKRTSRVKGTSNPEFDEAFSMFLARKDTDKTCIVITMMHQRGTGLFKCSKPIGRTVIGPFMYSTDNGLLHWDAAMQAQRSSVAQWHTLV